jgi:hypothetical protein
MNVVSRPADLVAEARDILNHARSQMRSEAHLTPREHQRINELITLAEEPAILRHAQWEHRRGRQTSPYRYRMELR